MGTEQIGPFCFSYSSLMKIPSQVYSQEVMHLQKYIAMQLTSLYCFSYVALLWFISLITHDSNRKDWKHTKRFWKVKETSHAWTFRKQSMYILWIKSPWWCTCRHINTTILCICLLFDEVNQTQHLTQLLMVHMRRSLVSHCCSKDMA